MYPVYECNVKATDTTQLITTNSHPITTTDIPSNQYPCSNKIFIAYDISSGLSSDEFEKETNFLIDYLFKNWTLFDSTFVLASYADSLTAKIFSNSATRSTIKDFIHQNKQVTYSPHLCLIFKELSYRINYYVVTKIIVFVSQFNVEYVQKNCANEVFQVQRELYLTTFVVLNDTISVDDLRHYFPRAQIIMWNLSEENDTPTNWKWNFDAAFGCEDNHDPSTYPCGGNKVLVSFDESGDINESDFNTQTGFLINNLFDTKWNNFNNIALIAQSNEMRRKDFGSMESLKDVHSFIINTTKTTSSISMCQVFNEMTKMYLLNINAILFVSKFHGQFGDECPFWIKQIRENVNSITFVDLTNQIDANYLLTKFPQSNFISWDTSKSKIPDNWKHESQKAFGCEDFTVESGEYPCNNDITIVYDNSRYLNPHFYQKFQKFLLFKVFIKEWSNFSNLKLLIYSNKTDTESFTNLNALKYIVRRTSMAVEEASFCKIFNNCGKCIDIYNRNYVHFLSKFNQTMVGDECLKDIEEFKKHMKTVTFFVIDEASVDSAYLKTLFPRAKIVLWNLEHENEYPSNWPQLLWESFGCAGLSPVHLPTTTTTSPPLSSTALTMPAIYTVLTSTEQTSSPTRSEIVIATTQIVSTTTSTSDESGLSKGTIISLSVSIPLFVVFLILFGVVIFWCKKRNRQSLIENMLSNNLNSLKTVIFNEKRNQDPWRIGMEHLQINFIDKLGSGAFGDVYLGKLIGDAPITQIYNDSPLLQKFHDCDVAVKALPAMQVDEYARNEFQKEIDFMKNLKFHQNVVAFLGYVSDPINPLMLLEYCANGDLLKFIKSNKQKFIENFENQENSCKTLILFAWQISSGLEYLGSLNLIHRDIAARNILLDKNNVCKISDFGLCRLSESLTYQSKGGKLPIRWMAPEAIKKNFFSTKTDVWSYGVLLYELFSLGDLPYADTESILAFIESGKRLEKPNYCSDEIYEIMLSCWEIDPGDRPTFTIICQLLTALIETATMHYNYVDTLALIEQIDEYDEIN